MIQDKEIMIPYLALTDSASLQKTVLLCEDSQDCLLFEIIAKYYSGQNNIHYPIAFQHLNGGGSRTHREFKNLYNEIPLKLCLCLADTDQKHPYGTKGSTANAFNGQLRKPYVHFEILDLHEIELFFPFKALPIALTSPLRTDQIQTIDYIIALENEDRPEMRYLDLKKGLELDHVFALDTAHGNYWKKLLLVKKPKTVSTQCVLDGECTCGNRCKIIHGLGENLLPQFLNYL